MIAAKKKPQRAERTARRLRPVSKPPLRPKVIEIPPEIPVLSGPNPRTYVLLWVRCCVGGEDDGGEGKARG